VAVLRDKLILEIEEQVVEIHTWRSSAGKEVRRREDHVGGNLLEVRLVVTLRVLFFHANQSLFRFSAAWGEPVTGAALGDKHSTTYKIG
jgi:hypothetical protein